MIIVAGSVSAAGDINGDGYADLLIGGVYWLWRGTSILRSSFIRPGRSYVVFGGPGVGKTVYLLLSSLDGSNGFKLDGENNFDEAAVPSAPPGTSMAMGIMMC